tara:strand:- start:20 stop:523 length:504 start_codon:yes stop_codon:yes gene_type:complete
MDNWNTDNESMVNKQINLELTASHIYLYLSTLVSNDSIGLLGMSKFLKEESIEERKHADEFIQLQIIRGGKPILGNISNPEFEFKGNESHLLQLFRYILQLEQSIYKNIVNISNNTDDKGLQKLLDDFIDEQLTTQYKLGIYIKQLENIGGDKSALFIFDKSIMDTE